MQNTDRLECSLESCLLHLVYCFQLSQIGVLSCNRGDLCLPLGGDGCNRVHRTILHVRRRCYLMVSRVDELYNQWVRIALKAMVVEFAVILVCLSAQCSNDAKDSEIEVKCYDKYLRIILQKSLQCMLRRNHLLLRIKFLKSWTLVRYHQLCII